MDKNMDLLTEEQQKLEHARIALRSKIEIAGIEQTYYEGLAQRCAQSMDFDGYHENGAKAAFHEATAAAFTEALQLIEGDN